MDCFPERVALDNWIRTCCDRQEAVKMRTGEPGGQITELGSSLEPHVCQALASRHQLSPLSCCFRKSSPHSEVGTTTPNLEMMNLRPMGIPTEPKIPSQDHAALRKSTILSKQVGGTPEGRKFQHIRRCTDFHQDWGRSFPVPTLLGETTAHVHWHKHKTVSLQ